MNVSQISRPGPGQTITIHAAGSNKIILDFSTQGITLSRDDSALIFTFYDGAAIRLDDFYKDYRADNIPEFEADGQLVSGAEFFSALGPDLMPAAGPAAAERSHSTQEYGDADLLGGVDHMDGLVMPDQEKSAAMGGGIQFDSALATGRGADFGGNPDAAGPDAPIPAPPLFPAGPFVRAVLYSPGNSADPVTTTVFFGGNGAAPAAVSAGDIDFAGSAPGAQYGVAVSLPVGWSTSWVDVSFDGGTGRLEFRLTADGAAEMQRLGLAGENLVDFIHVTVTDRASGDTFEYNVEFVATDNQNFDSAAHDSQYGGQHLDNIGEFHQGQNNGGAYSVTSSARNDEIILNDTVIGGSSIHASGSADPGHMADDYNTINLNAGVVNATPGSTTRITSADGELAVRGGVSVQGSGAGNVIDMGKGQVHVQNTSGDGVFASDGGKNTVSGGDVVVDAGDTGFFAKDGGSNTVGAQGGDVSINADGWGMVARDNATNSVAATGGSVNITTGKQALNASSGSVNSVTTIDGDITINATWDGAAAYDNSTNKLSATNGSVSIKTDTWGISSSTNSSTTVDVTNGNLEIDAIGIGIHAYGDSTDDGSVNGYSTNSVSVTDGDVNINAGWEGLMAHYGGTNKVAVDNGSVVITAAGSGLGAYFDSKNEMSVDGGSLHINSSASGIIADSGANLVTVTGGDIEISSTSAYDAAVSAIFEGTNEISTDGAMSVSGATIGIKAEEGGKNKLTGDDISITVTSKDGVYATDAGSTNEIFAGADGSVVISAGGSGLLAQTGGKNSVTSGDISITGSAYGVYANGSDSVNIIDGVGGTVSITSGNFLGVLAYNGGENRVTGNNIAIKTGISAFGGKSENTIDAGVDGKVTISGNVSSDLGGTNKIIGKEITAVSVGSSRSAYSSELLSQVGSSNELRTGADGTVSISSGVEASTCGSNTIASGTIFVGSPDRVAVNAGGQVGSGIGTNTLKAGEQGKVSIHGGSTGIYAANGGINSVTGGEVDIYGGNNGINSQDYNSKNIIDAGSSGSVSVRSLGTALSARNGSENTVKGGDITIDGSQVYALSAVSSKSTNTVYAGTDGVVRITGGDVGLWSQNGAQNNITGGNITITSANSGTVNSALYAASGNNTVIAGATGKVSIAGYLGLNANSGGKNDVSGGDITITGTGAYNAGVYSYGAQSVNTVDAGATGKVSISGTYGLETFGGKNIVNGGAITITGTSLGTGAMVASGGSNTVTSGAGGSVLVDGGTGMMAGGGGANTITGNTVSVVGKNYGLHAESSGNSSASTNTVQSASGALSLTIAATAASAEKAIAMWADGGRAVNYITGHSESGGTDSITLNGGVAMQTANGGKNIITTGSGDDHVTINGAVKGSGNQINVGEGSNTVTLNGVIEEGSLNVIASGGVYTLILQASSTEDFAERYGQWLNGIAADGLIAGGLTCINFDGLNVANLDADFVAAFNDLLYGLKDHVSIVPPELVEHLHDPAATPVAHFSATDGDAGAEHQTQDAQHAAAGHDASPQDAQHTTAGHDASTQDAQHAAAGHDASTQDAQHAAAGHDASTQETLLAVHEGSVLVTGDGNHEATFSVQPDTAALHAGILVPDDIAQPGLVAGEHEVEPAQPLFAFLNTPAGGTPTGMLADEGDAPVHNGYLGNGESGSGNAVVQGEIALTLGDESLDSLFAGTGQHLAENDGHGPWYVESGSVLHEVALADMSKIIVQGGSGEHASDPGVTIEEYAHFEHEAGSAPSVMDSNQEATDNAVREMTTY